MARSISILVFTILLATQGCKMFLSGGAECARKIPITWKERGVPDRPYRQIAVIRDHSEADLERDACVRGADAIIEAETVTAYDDGGSSERPEATEEMQGVAIRFAIDSPPNVSQKVDAVPSQVSPGVVVTPEGSPRIAAAPAPAVIESEPAADKTDFTISAPAIAPNIAEAKIRTIAIPDIAAPDLQAGLAKTLAEVMIAQAARVPGLTVVGANEVRERLGPERQRDLAGCQDNSACVAEIGRAVGVDGLLITSIGQAGGTYFASFTVIDIRGQRRLVRLTAKLRGHPDSLISVFEQAVPGALHPLFMGKGE